jgi:hypothetical protein
LAPFPVVELEFRCEGVEEAPNSEEAPNIEEAGGGAEAVNGVGGARGVELEGRKRLKGLL